MSEKNEMSQDFYKGIGVGILIILSLGFLIQTFSNGSISFGSGTPKTLKTVAKTADTGDTDTADQQIQIPDITSDDHISGDVNAKVSIVEYSDLECPFCQRFHNTLTDVVKANEGKVNWVYRHFPLASLHSKAPKEAEATECAAEQGGNEGFWNFMNKLMAVTPANNGLDLAQLPVIAEQVGLDGDKLQDCIDSGKYTAKVQSQYDDATNAGGRGTPFSVVVGPNGDIVPLNGAVPAEQVQAVIDSLLE